MALLPPLPRLPPPTAPVRDGAAKGKKQTFKSMNDAKTVGKLIAEKADWSFFAPGARPSELPKIYDHALITL